MRAPVSIVLALLLVLPACDSGNALDTSGELVLEDINVGEGPVVENGDAVMIAYSGALEDGTVFDVSDPQEPLAFTVGESRVIAGIDQGLVGMRAGGTRRMTIPPRLGYGADGLCSDASCPVPGNATVVFEVAVVRILDQPFIRDDTIGDGMAAAEGSFVLFHYSASLWNGTIVKNTTVFNDPVAVILDHQSGIPEGLEEGLIGMQAGGTRTIIIPPELAYGEAGNPPLVPSNAVMRFVVAMQLVTANN